MTVTSALLQFRHKPSRTHKPVNTDHAESDILRLCCTRVPAVRIRAAARSIFEVAVWSHVARLPSPITWSEHVITIDVFATELALESHWSYRQTAQQIAASAFSHGSCSYVACVMHPETFLRQFLKQADALQAADTENTQAEIAQQQQAKSRYQHSYLRSYLPNGAAARMESCHPEIFLSCFTPVDVAGGQAPNGHAKRPRICAPWGVCSSVGVQQAARAGAVQHGNAAAPPATCAGALRDCVVRVWVQEKGRKDKHGGGRLRPAAVHGRVREPFSGGTARTYL